MKRELRARPAVILRPSYVSDETCLQILGVTARKFRESVVPHCSRVTRIGHTVAVELEEAERVMRSLGAGASVDGAGPTDLAGDDDGPQTPEDVLRRLGKERVA